MAAEDAVHTQDVIREPGTSFFVPHMVVESVVVEMAAKSLQLEDQTCVQATVVEGDVLWKDAKNQLNPPQNFV